MAVTDRSRVGGSVGVAPGVGPLALQQRALQRRDHVVDPRLGYPDDRELLGDLDRADLATAEVALVGDQTDKVARSDAGLAAEADVDEAGAGGAAPMARRA